MTLRIEQDKGRKDRYAMLPLLLPPLLGRREHLTRACELLHVVPTVAAPPVLVAVPVAIVPLSRLSSSVHTVPRR